MIRKIKAKLILQLRAEGLSQRQIQTHGISGHSVTDVERAAAREGLSWQEASGMSETEVYERLFPGRGEYESVYMQPDWTRIHHELAHVGVTLKLLHAEYLDQCASNATAGMGYDRFCKTYTAFVLSRLSRVRDKRDKASVENTVWSVATWVIASLRKQDFATLPELREAIYQQVTMFNQQPFQKRAGSRSSVFENEEKPLLHRLPAVPYEISSWAYQRRVGRDGHVVWEKNHYSVPYTLVGQFVDLRITSGTVEIFSGGRRVSWHNLVPVGTYNQYRTRDGDLPEGPGYQEWDPGRVRAWAVRIGPNTSTVINRIFESVSVEEQGLDAALAILRLSRRYSGARLETACQMALATKIRSPRYVHLKRLLETGQDRTGIRRPTFAPAEEPAGFVRGAAYYGGEDK